MKKFLIAAFLLPLSALAQTYPSPTFSGLTLQSPLTGANGGTGVANSSTITLGGNLATSGANPLTFTTTGSTNVTLPTSGTLLNGSSGATAGANSNITSLSGLTTPLSVSQGGTGVATSTGTGSAVLNTSAVLVTPALGTPSSAVLTNGTGLPVSTGISGLGTGVAAGLANAATGSGAPVLGTSPTISGVNLTGVPVAPTASTGTSTTQLATTQFTANTFASPPSSGYGSTTPEPVSATTISSSYLTMSPSITWSGSSSGSASLSPLWEQEALSGTSSASAGTVALFGNQINVQSNLNMSSSFTFLDGLNVNVNPGSSSVGSYNAIDAYVFANTKPADSNPGNSNPAYVGILPRAATNVNLGGTGTTYATASGGIWGSNPNVTLGNGATDINNLVGEEVDVTANTGSSVAGKWGISIVQSANDHVSGSQDDAGIEIQNQSGAVGWAEGIQFGSANAFWPIQSSGDLVAVKIGHSSSATVTNALNFSQLTISGDLIDYTPFTVTGTGHIVTNGGSTPAVSSCGTSPSISGSDAAGEVTLGTGSPTACTVTFAHAYSAEPHCVMTGVGSTTTTAITITALSLAAFTVSSPNQAAFAYICMQ